MDVRVEVAVVGAGVVGLAVAAELARDRTVAVIERHESYGRENSSHNSGVVHAGIYYPPNWLKTTLCVEGNPLLYEWAEQHKVRARRVGKLIIAVSEEELPALDALHASASANGVPELSMLSRRQVQALEPAIAAEAALFSGSTGVVDQMELMRSLLNAAQEHGALVAFKHTLEAVQRVDGGFALTVVDPDSAPLTVAASALVNSAGLSADRVASMLSYPLDGTAEVPRLRQRVVKGRYYDIVASKKAAQLKHLIYPLPHSDRSGLGVHVTLDVDGGVHLGPDTEWLDPEAALDYRSDDTRRAAFVDSARRYLPWLEMDDVAPGQVGYRTKLHGEGEGPCDFLVWHDHGYVHLGGIESPGMTASLALARRVREILG